MFIVYIMTSTNIVSFIGRNKLKIGIILFVICMGVMIKTQLRENMESEDSLHSHLKNSIKRHHKKHNLFVQLMDGYKKWVEEHPENEKVHKQHEEIYNKFVNKHNTPVTIDSIKDENERKIFEKQEQALTKQLSNIVMRENGSLEGPFDVTLHTDKRDIQISDTDFHKWIERYYGTSRKLMKLGESLGSPAVTYEGKLAFLNKE